MLCQVEEQRHLAESAEVAGHFLLITFQGKQTKCPLVVESIPTISPRVTFSKQINTCLDFVEHPTVRCLNGNVTLHSGFNRFVLE